MLKHYSLMIVIKIANPSNIELTVLVKRNFKDQSKWKSKWN